MRLVSSLLVVFVCFARGAFAQGFTATDRDIGVAHYSHPQPTEFRALFAMGGNAGLMNDEPLTTLGIASYQMDRSLLSGSIVSSSSTSGYPRKNFTEFDLMYGYIFGGEVARYERPPQFFHFSASVGLGFDTYNERYRRYRRGTPQELMQPLPFNVFEYALGFPLQVEALFEPFRYAGFGVVAFASFNRVSPDYGAALAIEARY